MSSVLGQQPLGLGFYGAAAGRYDELIGPDGAVREHWRPFVDRLLEEGADAARGGLELARRLVVENGVTYNVYADPLGRDRPWSLDPLPLVVPAAEWRLIEAGALQRARLLDALLADLYGPQTLLADGSLPPELVFGHPNYLWPCRDSLPPGERWLHLYAMDLARAPDGQWWVLGERTQSPSGLGYAIENRQIVSRVYPELAKDMGVRSLIGGLAALKEGLLAAAGVDAPLAVVLTPGPFNETYFEHAYLARQLGLPLVEGGDLTVRGETVFLKTLSGLRRVHAILRRLDDDFCDPAELRADSALGVPGLLGAVRAGRVVMANALGAGVIECAAMLGFLPGVATRLLGEELLLPSVATWWCGEQAALDYVVEHLERLVVKAAFPNQRFEPVFGRDLDAAGRAALVQRLRSRPHAYVAQERIQFSQAPAWTSGIRGKGLPPGIAARSVGMRVFAVATEGGYRILPGGMARIASDSAVDVVSSQRGGGSKDVWVLAEGAGAVEDDADDAALTAPPERQGELPSVLVENLFWLGRYAERCEDKTRLLRATFAARADGRSWKQALAVCSAFGVLDARSEPSRGLFDAAQPQSLAADLGRLAWSATRSRSRLSLEHWRSLNELKRNLSMADEAREDPRETLDRLALGLAAFAGFTLDDMTQDDGWRILMLGRHLERIQFLASLFAFSARAGRRLARGELAWLLDVAGSTITHRTRHASSPSLLSVVQTLVLDESNPRAVAFHRRRVHAALEQLSRATGVDVEDAIEPVLARLPAALGPLLDAPEGSEARSGLAQLMLELHGAAARVCDRLGERHFSHTGQGLHGVAA